MLKNRRRLEKRLRGTGSALERAAKEGALAAAERAAEAARGRVPVETGRLRASIGVRGVEDGAAVAADCGYAAAVELGSSRCAARPFLMPSAQESGFAQEVRKHVRSELRRR